MSDRPDWVQGLLAAMIETRDEVAQVRAEVAKVRSELVQVRSDVMDRIDRLQGTITTMRDRTR